MKWQPRSASAWCLVGILVIAGVVAFVPWDEVPPAHAISGPDPDAPETVPAHAGVHIEPQESLRHADTASNAPPRSVAESHTEGLTGAGIDQAWGARPVNKRPLGRLFVLAPMGITGKWLLRHRLLNPGDVRIPDVDLHEFDDLVAKHQALLTDASDRLQLCKSKRTKELLAANRLTELTMDLVPEDKRAALVELALARSAHTKALLQVDAGGDADAVRTELARTAGTYVPGAARIIQKAGRIYAATADQFGDDVRELAVDYARCRRDFFCAVIAWFVGKGLTTVELLVEEFEAFEELNRQGPFQR